MSKTDENNQKKLNNKKAKDKRAKIKKEASDYGIKCKEILFCQEYTIDFNATKASIRAGYPQSTASGCGERLLQNSKILLKIENIIEKRIKGINLSSESIIQELKSIAFVKLENNPHKVKVDMKIKSLQELSKILGLYKEDNEQKELKIIIEKV